MVKNILEAKAYWTHELLSKDIKVFVYYGLLNLVHTVNREKSIDLRILQLVHYSWAYENQSLHLPT